MGARRRVFIIGMLLLIAPISALAAGTITKVTPNPIPGVSCQLNTIRIDGTGTGTGFTFDLGDGTNIVNLPGNFPIWVYHTFKSPGTYTLKAQGKGNITGAVTTTLQVVGPTITSIFPFSVIKPGGEVILQGQNFGDLPGQILIVFQNQLIGTYLTNIQWGNNFAAGTIPPGITGEPDQTVGLYVNNSCGAASNHVSAKFTATRALVALPFGQINCGSTATLGNSDACQNSGNYGTPPECFEILNFGVEPGPTGFQGYHFSGWGFSGEAGNDQFWGPTLKNGWAFDSASSLSGDYVGTFYQPTYWYQSPVGGTETKVSVNWRCDNCGGIFYYGNIYITGPIGVPYQ